jgi:sterol desaturase/sphingolipid hydroxylase (fatty acid hydroxylase superfamily)
MELVFDFFHYCSHRLSHTIPALYTRFHKIHHSHHADLHVGSTLQVIRPQVPLRR